MGTTEENWSQHDLVREQWWRIRHFVDEIEAGKRPMMLPSIETAPVRIEIPSESGEGTASGANAPEVRRAYAKETALKRNFHVRKRASEDDVQYDENAELP